MQLKPKTPLQNRFFEMGYVVTNEGFIFEAFSPGGERLAKSGYVSDCWNACYEHLDKQNAFINNMQAIFSHDHDYSGDHGNELVREIQRTMENLEAILATVKRLDAIERRAINFHGSSALSEQAQAIIENILGYKPLPEK